MATTQSRMVADASPSGPAGPIELVGVTTFGDVTKAEPGPARRHRRVRQRAARQAARGRDRLRRPLAEGPAHQAGPARISAGRHARPRDDPRDALVGDGKLADLPPGARVGTGSPRRVAQLRALRPDLDYVPIRGNADTRIGKVTSGELHAVVLAAAGLARIGRDGRDRPDLRGRGDAARARAGRAGRGVPVRPRRPRRASSACSTTRGPAPR